MHDSRRRRSRALRWLVLAPIWAFVFAPIAAVFVASIGEDAIPRLPPRGLSLEWYRQALEQSEVLAAVRTSAWIALWSATVALVVATPAAYAVVRYRFHGRRVAEALLVAPIVVPQVVIGIGMLILFSRYDVFSNTTELVVVHAIIIVPFVTAIMIASFEAVDRSLEEAAQVLGASGVGAFVRVTLPIALPGFIAAGGIAFVISFTQFTVSLFVFDGDQAPYPVWIYQSLSSDYTPMIPIAVSGLVILAIVAIVFLVGRLGNLSRAVGVRER